MAASRSSRRERWRTRLSTVKTDLTGGWGFAQSNDGKPADEALHKTCFSCHEPAKDRGFVSTVTHLNVTAPNV
jgi:hypothetical protein